jgi:hypothetical protein
MKRTNFGFLMRDLPFIFSKAVQIPAIATEMVSGM